MQVHLLRGDLDFHWLQSNGESEWNFQSGVAASSTWTVPRLVLSDDEGTEFLPVDCLPMNTGCDGPVLSEFACRMLAGSLRQAGELLPVDVLGRRYWWFNCLSTVRALDLARTDAEWGTVQGDAGPFRWILEPRVLVFDATQVAAAPPVFRVPEFPHGALFAGEGLKQAIAEHKLTGFRLDLVWSSERGGVRDPAGFGFTDAWTQAHPGEVERKRALARAVLLERGT